MAGILPWPTERWTPPGRTEEIDRRISVDRLADLAIAWPWPYSPEEIEIIGRDLPEPARLQALRAIVTTGRRSAIASEARRREGDHPRREDPRLELERLRLALEGMSLDVWRLLAVFDFKPDRLLSSIYAIEMSLPDPKPRTARGGASKSRDDATVAAFRSIYEQAFGGKLRKNGYPPFLNACIGPLGFDLHLDPSARRHQRRRVK